jgi:uncharacterized protein (TIGR03437 family)
MRTSKLIGIYLCLALLALGVFASPAAAAGLNASPSSLTFCSPLAQTVTVTTTSGGTPSGLHAALNDPLGIFAAQITGNIVTVSVQRGTPGSAQLTITDDSSNSVIVGLALLNSSSDPNCGGGGGGGGTGGTLAVTPLSVPLTASSVNSYSTAANLSITSTSGTEIPFSVTVSTTSGGNWLIATPVSGTSPATLTVYALTTGLTMNTGYSGSITISGGSSVVNIPVTLMVGTGTVTGLMANPSALNLNDGIAQALAISNTAATGYTAYAMPDSGSWLLMNGHTVPVAGSLPGSISVSANTAVMTAGTTYTGKILIVDNFGNRIEVPVAANPAGGSTGPLTLSPSTVNLTSPAGSTSPVNSAVGVSSMYSGVTFSAAVTAGNSWLSLSVSGTSMPGTITVRANPSGLSGTQTGQITVTTFGTGATTAVLPVTFVIGSGTATSQVAPSAFSFAYQAGFSTSVPSQTLSINGTVGSSYSTAITYTKGSGWLSISSPSGTIPATGPANLTVSIANTGLAAGTYTANIGVTSSGGTQTVPVTLIVSSGIVLTASPTGSLYFNITAGSTADTSQNLVLNTNSGQAASFSVSSAANWITVTPVSGTTPAYVSVRVSPVGLSPGLNSASLQVTGSPVGNSPMTIPVVVAVTGGITVSPTSLTFSAAPGGTPAAKGLSLSAASATSFTAAASTTSGGNWLSLSATTGTTPANLTVYVSSASLTAGTYNGNIAISSNGLIQNVPVTLTIGSGTGGTLTFNPTSLTFAGAAGGAVPSIQGVQVGSAVVGQAITAEASTTSGGNWLTVSPTSTNAPITLTVSVNQANLAAGTYQGTITVTPSGGTAQTIPVTFTVTGGVTANPATLSFNYRAGDNPPDAQSVALTGTGAAAATFTASASSQGNWLAVTPASGALPGSLSVSIHTDSVTAGSFTGTITITPSTGAPVTVNVTLTVTAPLPTLSSVVNAASYLGGAVSPGEIVTLFGESLGPSQGVGLALDSTGKVATTLANTQVLFNGIAAPMVYTSAGQVSAVVPYEIAGRQTTSVWIKFAGVSSNAVNLGVTTTAPGLFTLNASGSGAGAILNQDYSVNSSSSPASPGGIVLLYATGEGQTVPAGVTGSVTSGNSLPAPVLPVAVLIDGQPASILYAGAAPGMVAGAMQINVRIPDGVRSGQVPVVVSVGGNSSQSGVTLTVR